MNNYMNMHAYKTKMANYIYRIISYSDLKRIVETGQNSLSSTLNWKGEINGDKHENCIMNSNFQTEIGNKIDIKFRDDFYCQSWSVNFLSDAMWQIYSCPVGQLHNEKELNDDNVAIRIRTTIPSLFNSLKTHFPNNNDKCFIGKVKYVRDSHLSDLANHVFNSGHIDSQLIASTLFYKRKHFKHEGEIRLVFFSENSDKNNISGGPNGKFFYGYEYDFLKEVDQIMIDPRLSLKEGKEIKEKIIKLTKIEKEKVLRSKLYREPKLDVVVLNHKI